MWFTNVGYVGGTVTNYATTYTYDRRGRRKTAVRNGIAITWTEERLPG